MKKKELELDRLSLGDLFIFLNGLNERTYGIYLGHEYNDAKDRIINYTKIFTEDINGKKSYTFFGEKTWVFSSIVGATLHIPERPLPLLQLGLDFFTIAYGMKKIDPYNEEWDQQINLMTI